MNTDKAKVEAQEAADKAAHSASADKAKGHTNEVVGSIKEKFGNLVGDDKLAAKGTVQNAEGKKDVLKGEIKEKIDEVSDKVKAGIEVVKDKIKEARS